MHHRNIRALAIEICKVIYGISPPLLNEVFVLRQVIMNFVEITFQREEDLNQ